MATLSTLKLVTSKKHISISPVLHRRNKIICKIQEQIDLCVAKKDGNVYAPKQLKTYTDKHTGERKTIESVSIVVITNSERDRMQKVKKHLKLCQETKRI